jgi:hypothetical protein
VDAHGPFGPCTRVFIIHVSSHLCCAFADLKLSAQPRHTHVHRNGMLSGLRVEHIRQVSFYSFCLLLLTISFSCLPFPPSKSMHDPCVCPPAHKISPPLAMFPLTPPVLRPPSCIHHAPLACIHRPSLAHPRPPPASLLFPSSIPHLPPPCPPRLSHPPPPACPLPASLACHHTYTGRPSPAYTGCPSRQRPPTACPSPAAVPCRLPVPHPPPSRVHHPCHARIHRPSIVCAAARLPPARPSAGDHALCWTGGTRAGSGTQAGSGMRAGSGTHSRMPPPRTV